MNKQCGIVKCSDVSDVSDASQIFLFLFLVKTNFRKCIPAILLRFAMDREEDFKGKFHYSRYSTVLIIKLLLLVFKYFPLVHKYVTRYFPKERCN